MLTHRRGLYANCMPLVPNSLMDYRCISFYGGLSCRSCRSCVRWNIRWGPQNRLSRTLSRSCRLEVFHSNDNIISLFTCGFVHPPLTQIKGFVRVAMPLLKPASFQVGELITTPRVGTRVLSFVASGEVEVRPPPGCAIIATLHRLCRLLTGASVLGRLNFV